MKMRPAGHVTNSAVVSQFLPTRASENIHLLQSIASNTLPIVMIHGYGEGAYVWEDVMQHYQGKYSMLAFDLPGHGRSHHRSTGGYSTAGAVQDVMVAMNQLNIDRFLIIGHSWGGSIALHIGADNPQRVVGIVVVDTGPKQNPEAMRHVRNSLSASLKTYRSVDEYAKWLTERRPLVASSVIKRIATESTRQRSDGLFELRVDAALVRDSSVGPESLWSILPQIEAEVLLIRGQMSGVLSSSMAESMRQKIKRCHLRTVTRAGHSVMIDNAAGFISMIDPFLKQSAVSEIQADKDVSTAFDLIARELIEVGNE